MRQSKQYIAFYSRADAAILNAGKLWRLLKAAIKRGEPVDKALLGEVVTELRVASSSLESKTK